jgi:hypothetical protein
MEQKIAGINPIDISKEPYLGITSGLVRELEKEYLNSLSEEPPTPLVGDSKEYKYPELVLGRYSGSPTQLFGINRNLIEMIKNVSLENKEFVSEEDLYILALQNMEGLFNPDFSFDALNDLNQIYFALKGSFSSAVGLSVILNNNLAINASIARVIDYHFPLTRKTVKIKELAYGQRENRWNVVGANVGHRNFDVTLTDFHELIELPSEVTAPNIKISHGLYNFLEDFEMVELEDKFDLILTTYGFDSIWQEGDIRYVKYHDQWYRSSLRLRVLDWHRKKDRLIQSLLTGVPYEGMEVMDLEGIFIEEAVEKIDLSLEPFGEYIAAEFSSFQNVKVNFPGGLIQTVDDAFKKQLLQDGVFLIGDVAVFEESDRDSALKAYGISGTVARFKVEDYLLAKKILEKAYNYKVEIYSLDRFVSTYLGPDWENNFDEIEISNVKNTKSNCFMKVSAR